MLNIDKVINFPFPTPPSKESLQVILSNVQKIAGSIFMVCDIKLQNHCVVQNQRLALFRKILTSDSNITCIPPYEFSYGLQMNVTSYIIRGRN